MDHKGWYIPSWITGWGGGQTVVDYDLVSSILTVLETSSVGGVAGICRADVYEKTGDSVGQGTSISKGDVLTVDGVGIDSLVVGNRYFFSVIS